MQTYKNLSTLIKNYFVLLASSQGRRETEYSVEEQVDRLGFSTYNITVKTSECDRVMQKVLDDAQH